MRRDQFWHVPGPSHPHFFSFIVAHPSLFRALLALLPAMVSLPSEDRPVLRPADCHLLAASEMQHSDFVQSLVVNQYSTAAEAI